MSEIPHNPNLPQILFTQRALEAAQEEGVVDIVPDAEQIRGIGELVTQTFPEYSFPESLEELAIVIRRGGGLPGSWDMTYRFAAPSQLYYPRSDLRSAPENRQPITRAELAGRKVTEMTITNWQEKSPTGPFARTRQRKKSPTGPFARGLMYPPEELFSIEKSSVGILVNVTSVLTTSRSIRDRERDAVEYTAVERFPNAFKVVYEHTD